MGKNNAGDGSSDREWSSLLDKWKRRADELKLQTYSLVLALRDRRTPWYAKAWVGLVVAYAFSPIDLIPDFIPLLGYLDDLLLVPLGIFLALKMIPPEVMADARRSAQQASGPGSGARRLGTAIVIFVWLVLLALAAVIIFQVVEPAAGKN
jgi:uncharacterized membrane protein YkvA (DUF1232 family)